MLFNRTLTNDNNILVLDVKKHKQDLWESK